jgi:hypothetical protein
VVGSEPRNGTASGTHSALVAKAFSPQHHPIPASLPRQMPLYWRMLAANCSKLECASANENSSERMNCSCKPYCSKLGNSFAEYLQNLSPETSVSILQENSTAPKAVKTFAGNLQVLSQTTWNSLCINRAIVLQEGCKSICSKLHFAEKLQALCR